MRPTRDMLNALELDEQQAYLLELLDIPPTEQVHGSSTRWSASGRSVAEMALERDLLMAKRPAGCWCLGLGGRRPTWFGRSAAAGFQDYCSCPDGEARLAHDLERQQLARRAEAERRAELFREDLPPRLQRFALDGYPSAGAAQRRLVQQLRGWIRIQRELAFGNIDDDGSVKRWLLAHGSYGAGKSAASVAVAAELIAEGVVSQATFVPAPEMLDRLKSTFDRGAHERTAEVLDELYDVPLLILDDLGAERRSEWATETLTSLLNSRYDHELRTIITTNLTPAELGAHLGERAMWRIAEFAEVADMSKLPNLRAPRRPALEVVNG